MTPDEMREALRLLHWSQRGLADILDTHQTTVRRWAMGAQPIPDSVGAWLRAISAPLRTMPTPAGWRTSSP